MMQLKIKKISYLLFVLIASIIIIVGSSFAYFGIVPSIVSPGDIDVEATTLSMNLEGCNEMELTNTLPGATITCTYRVTNTGNKYLIYDYALTDVVNEFERTSDLIYKVKKNGLVVKEKTFPTKTENIINDNCLAPLETDTYTIIITYLNTIEDQNVDMNKTASANVDVVNIEHGDQCFTRTYTLRIDPTPGMYKGSKALTTYDLEMGETVSIENATASSAYVFQGWSASDGNTYTDLVEVRGNLTLAAIWDVNPDAVCRINDTYYMSIADANDDANDGDVIVMVKNDSEDATIDKKVTLDLNGFTINGSINNSDNLTIIGEGSIISNNDAIVNNGILTIGSDDGVVSISAPHIEGVNNGVNNNGTLNFYDGILIGLEANSGLYNLIPEDYYVFVNHNNDTNIQSAWLVNGYDTRAICRISRVLFMNLNDAIKYHDTDTIHFIRDAELAYQIENASTSNRVIDIDGYTIESGYAFINDGILTLTDLNGEKGVWNTSVAITNNNSLTLTDLKITTTTNAAVIDNYGNTIINNSTLLSNSSYTYNSYAGTTSLDSTSIIKTNATSYSVKLSGESTFNGTGTIYGIYNNTTDTTHFNNLKINDSNSEALYSNKDGSIYLNNVTITSNQTRIININNGKLYLDDSSISSDIGRYGIYVSSNGKAYISNTTYDLTDYAVYSEGYVEINNYSGTSGQYISNNSRGIFNISNSNVTCNGTYCISNSSSSSQIIDNLTLNTNQIGITSSSGTISINNSNINAYRNALAINGTNSSANININNSNILSTNDYAIDLYNYFNLNINSGSVISNTTYAIYFNSRYSSSTVTIGTEDETVSINNPIIRGETYGIYQSSSNVGKLKIYDGVLMGQTNPNYGEISATQSKYNLVNQEVTIIDDKTYQTAYLVMAPCFARVDQEEYNSITDALTAARSSSSKTITIINNHMFSEQVNILTTDDIIIDLNGYELKTSYSINVLGKLKLMDSSSSGTGSLIGYDNYVLKLDDYNGNAELTIDSGNYSGGTNGVIDLDYSANNKVVINGGNISTTGYYAIYMYNGILEINNGTISNNNGNAVYARGIFTVNGGTLTSAARETVVIKGKTTINGGVINNTYSSGKSLFYDCSYSGCISDAYLKIYDATITGSYYALYMYGRNINIYGGTFSGYHALYNDGSTIYVHDGNFTSNSSDAIRNTGSLYLYGGNITSNKDNGIWSSNSKLVVGREDGVVNEDITITGKTYGIYLNRSTIDLYDGVIKGVTAPINSEPMNIQNGYTPSYQTEVINDVTYQTLHLTKLDNYVIDDNDNTYSSIQEAFDSCLDTEVCNLKLLKTISLNENLEIASGKSIVLDLDGHNFSNTMYTNIYGNYTITNNNETNESNLTLYSYLGGLINKSTGTIEISNINIIFELRESSSMVYALSQEQNGIFNFINCHFVKNYNSNSFVSSFRYGSTNVTNCTYDGDYLFYFENNVSVDGGTYNTSTTNYIFNFYYATYIINNLNINGKIYLEYGTGTIKNTTINTLNASPITTRATTLTLDNSVLTNNSSEATLNQTGGEVTINDTTITNNGSGEAIRDNSSYYSVLNVNSGTITSSGNYGIRVYRILNLGSNDNTVNINSPIIKGELYGVYNSGTFNFYDGKLLGKTGGYNNISTTATDYDVFYDTEEEYVVNYLVRTIAFVKNGDVTYTNLQTAVNEANNGDTLEFIENGATYYEINIPSGKTITWDLNGKTLTFNYGVTNNGSLVITDTSINPGTINYTVNSSSSYFIDNKNTLNISNISITGGSLVLSNGNVLNITNATLNSKYNGIYATNLNITDSTVSSSYNYNSSYYNAVRVSDLLIMDGCTLINTATYGSLALIDAQATVTDSMFGGTVLISGSDNLVTFNSSTFNYNNNSYNAFYSSSTGEVVFNNVIAYHGNNSYGSTIVHSGKLSGSKLTAYGSNGIVKSDTLSVLGSIDMDEVDLYNNSTTGNSSYAFYYHGSSNSTINNLNINGVTGNGIYIAANSNLIINNASINLTENNNNVYGIYASDTTFGDLLINNIDLTINSETAHNIYGIYNNGSGSITFESGNINVSNTSTSTSNKSYGIYNNGSGSVIMGVKDNSYNVNDPIVYAASTNGTGIGIGVKKINGFFKFFDGKITGSTNAKPETTSLVETGYEVVFYTDSDGYEYCVLEQLID